MLIKFAAMLNNGINIACKTYFCNVFKINEEIE